MNKLDLKSDTPATPLTKLDIRTLSDEEMVKSEYASICSEYGANGQWIMMINPEEDSLEQLASNEAIDPSRVLKVNSRHREVRLNNIERALLKGNCSALILCNPKLANNEVNRLTKMASKGKTQCIILNTKHQIH